MDLNRPIQKRVLLQTGALLIALSACGTAVVNAPVTPAPSGSATDPRIGLRAGMTDAGTAIRGMELLASRPKPEGLFNPANAGDIFFANSDMAFRGTELWMGNFAGFQMFDISNPAAPVLRTTVVCPGGQGDLSVHGNLLFMSVEMPNGLIDCGTGGSLSPAADRKRFRGVRIFDISDVTRPRQVGAVQTCRGSHTHTLVTDPDDRANVWLYVSGTSTVRPTVELAGCSDLSPAQDPNTSLFRIEVIRVPLAAPQNAAIVSAPRIFANERGDIAGLYTGGTRRSGAQETAITDQCHDITVYPEIGLAAGACSGNGILLDISDPENPRRIDDVFDPNFAYWHSATFNNAGTSVIFTDEWGGGTAARCRREDRREWGANALFELNNRELTQRAYYKLPAPQTAQENCVAHNGSLVPVPGRDIMVQAWYQGGISVFDFTDIRNPVEIAFFDRGPVDANQLMLGGVWSAYYYNGNIYGSEIGRGLDVLRLVPGEHLTQNEIDAAALARMDGFNPQTQQRITWPAHVSVAKAYLDQLARGTDVPSDRIASMRSALDAADAVAGSARSAAFTQLAATATQLQGSAADADARRLGMLAETLRGLADR